MRGNLSFMTRYSLKKLLLAVAMIGVLCTFRVGKGNRVLVWDDVEIYGAMWLYQTTFDVGFYISWPVDSNGNLKAGPIHHFPFNHASSQAKRWEPIKRWPL